MNFIRVDLCHNVVPVPRSGISWLFLDDENGKSRLISTYHFQYAKKEPVPIRNRLPITAKFNYPGD
jgi:hypothetical protein